MAPGLQEEAVMGEAAVVPSAMGGGCTKGRARGMGQVDAHVGGCTRGGADPPERWEKEEGGEGLTSTVGTSRVVLPFVFCSTRLAYFFSLESGRSGKSSEQSRISHEVELLCSEFRNSQAGWESGLANIAGQFSELIL